MIARASSKSSSRHTGQDLAFLSDSKSRALLIKSDFSKQPVVLPAKWRITSLSSLVELSCDAEDGIDGWDASASLRALTRSSFSIKPSVETPCCFKAALRSFTDLDIKICTAKMDAVSPESFDGRVLKVLQTKLCELQAAMLSQTATAQELASQFDREDQKLKDLEPAKVQQIAKQDVTRESLNIISERVHEAKSDLSTAAASLQASLHAKVAKNEELRQTRESIRHIAVEMKQMKLIADQHKRDIKRQLIAQQKLDDEYPKLCEKSDKCKATVAALQEDCESQTTLTVKLKQEVETLLTAFIKQDDMEKDRNEELLLLREDRVAMEQEAVEAKRHLRTWSDTESTVTHSLQRLRMRLKHECMRFKSKLEDIRVQEVERRNLEEDADEIGRQLRKLSNDFDSARVQRNMVVSSMHNTAQQLSDIRKRIQTAAEELKVLNSDQEAKALQIKTAEISVEDQMRVRNALKADVMRTQAKCKSDRSSIEENVGSIEKQTKMISQLKSRVNELEVDATRAKQQVRDLTLGLVEKNDDLCVLWEGIEDQKNIKRSHENNLSNITDDIKMKTLDIADFSSNIQALKRKIPAISSLHAKRMHLQGVVINLVSNANELASKIENPESGMIAWRCIGGPNLDLPTLAAKARVLQNRIDLTKEARVTRETELERLIADVSKFESANQENMTEQARLASQVNRLQAQSNRIVRKLFASVSELSLYQSKSSTLDTEVARITQQVNQARENLSNGIAPTDDADEKLGKILRKEQLYQEYLKSNMDRKALEQDVGDMDGPRSTAHARVNAYIPEHDALGLPRAYGGRPPFLPTPNGSNMRHYR